MMTTLFGSFGSNPYGKDGLCPSTVLKIKRRQPQQLCKSDLNPSGQARSLSTRKDAKRLN